jgi:hypothetical protein
MELLIVLNKTPSSKLAADTAKYVAFRKALRKVLNDQIENETLINKEYEVAVKELQDKALVIQKELADLKSKEASTAADKKAIDNLDRQLQGLQMQINICNVERQKKMVALSESLKGQEAEVTFNIEDADYIRRLLTDNASVFFSFKRGEEELFDAETYDSLTSLLDQKQEVPDNK